jgi:hypothetical protein
MNQEKYIGMDVHQATISVAVMDGKGKLIMECVLETKAATMVELSNHHEGCQPSYCIEIGSASPCAV